MRDFAEKLAQHQREVLWYKEELEKANKELAMANTALSALANSIEKMRQDLLDKTAFTITSQVMPLIGDIRNDKLPEQSKVKLDVLVAYLRNMAEGVSRVQDAIPSLSSIIAVASEMPGNSTLINSFWYAKVSGGRGGYEIFRRRKAERNSFYWSKMGVVVSRKFLCR